MAVLLLAIVFYCCNHSGQESRDAQAQTHVAKNSDSRLDAAAGQVPPAQAEDSLPVQYSIEAIDISPQYLYRDSTITAIAKTLPTELPQEVQLNYVFWLNAVIAQEGIENRLTRVAAKKHDLLYVDAILTSDGQVLARKRSAMIKILNSSPRIETVDFPEINGPGQYTIKINASDADSDPLSYALEGEAIPDSTTVDATGAVKITLSSQSPENIVFRVVVKDNEDGETSQEIKLNFTKKLVKKEY